MPCARYLSRFAFHVMEAADGEQALRSINDTPPHVIMVEIGLPILSAGRLTRWLAQNWRTRHIPIIVLTGEVTPGLEDEPPATAAALLVKPFQLPDMLDEVRRVIRAHGI